jgi:enoyl-CoA hydratase/carnithine racemase
MSVRLPERVGRSMAKQLMFTSRRIDAATAAAIGLVDVVAPDADLDAAVERLAAEILANSPGTNRRVKRLIADRDDRTRTDALLHERTLPYGLPEDMQDRMSRG